MSDNASTDDTPVVLEALAHEHPKLVWRRHDSNLGPTANFRAVADESADEFFMWLGDDDWIDPDYLERCVAELEADDTLVLVAGRARYHDGNESWLGVDQVCATGGDPARRVLDYFRQVRANGVFYGVIRTSALRQVPPLQNCMGGDWLHLAALSYLGGVRTVRGTEVHRSVGGATRNLAEVARQLELGWLSENAPQVVITWRVLADIGWRSNVYSELSHPARIGLGSRAAAIVFLRFVPGTTRKKVGRLLGELRGRTGSQHGSALARRSG